MADEAAPGAGNIPITLDGKEMELVPTLDACIRISAIGGGISAASQRCRQLDFDTVCQIVSAGLGLNPVQAKTVPPAVYKTGLIAIAEACIDFCHVVANGGRPPEEQEGQDDENPDPPQPA